MPDYKLRPYQDAAADFLYGRDRAMLLAPVGAGKTAITLTAMYDMLQDGHVNRWLVVAPKRVVTDVWPVEGPKWAPRLDMALAVGTPKQREAAFKSTARVVVVNYENLQTLPDLKGFNGVVFDELTRMKNPSGIRFKVFSKQLERFTVRWGLTGSFTSNGLEDVFGQCRVIDENLLGKTKTGFMRSYFFCVDRDHGGYIAKAGALETVMDRIKPATHVLDAGVYKDKLPPLNVVNVVSDMPDRAHYEQMRRDFVATVRGTEVTALTAAAVGSKLQQMAAGFVYNTVTRPSDVPGKFVSDKEPLWFSRHRFDAIDDVLEGNQRANTIIVYNFREELAELKRRYPKAATIDEPGVVERWNRGEVPILLIHPMSAGHGLNLQFGGSKMIFASLPWSLELYEQTIGRIHRGGQEHAVWVYVMMTKDTIDERMFAALGDKQALSALALEELKS